MARLIECGKNRSGEVIQGRFEGVRQLADEFQMKTRTKEATVSDYIRLVTLERELRGEEMVSEVRVTWVQKFEPESGT